MRDKIKGVWKRIYINREYCLHFSFKWTGIFFSILGAVGLIAPMNELLDEDLGLFLKIILASLILLAVWLTTFIIGAISALHKKSVKLFSIGNSHYVYVQYGDILQNASLGEGRKNIVIPVNRCFDTIVNDDLVSANTLHGKVMQGLYAGGKYTPEMLNQEIQEKLKGKEFENIDLKQKPQGNLKRYAAGTVAEISVSQKENYFFLALSTFDEELHAHTSSAEHIDALTKVFQFCQCRSQGYPVLMPLIGSGASETGKEEVDILEYMIKLIKMERRYFNSDIYIIVRESAKDIIPISCLV